MPADQPMSTDETPTGKSDAANDQAGGAAEGSIGPVGAEQEQDRERLARGLVKYYAAWSIGAGIVPVPIVDMLLVMGVQVQMLRKMSDLYGVPFSEHVARNLVGALVGGAGSEVVAGGLVGPVVRLIPGIGPFLGALTMPAIAAASTASRKPGAIECESMKVPAKSGGFFVGDQDMQPFGGERWSNGHQLLVKATALGDSVEIEVPCPVAAPRKLVLHATQAPDFATLRFAINGQAVTGMLDCHATGVQAAPAFVLGVFTPHDGKFSLHVEVAGANPASIGAKYFFGLDCVTLEAP